MKYLIVGLGNIGSEYTETRHNIGFKVAEAIASTLAGSFTTERYGDICQVKHKGRTLILLKPSTYMNLSGKAVSYWMQREKIGIENIFVIVDDLAIPYGSIRLRGKGSDGGHNGLKSISEVLKSDLYPRLRFGIGSDFSKGGQIDYVLGKWSEQERLQLAPLIETAKDAVLSFATAGIERTMNTFNKK